jgi:nanoRNase/pAp phosphatase (c-di-AMP/oligoRNAs hydrolase)
MDFQSFKDQFMALAGNATAVAITSHMSADDDSIGSVLAMYDVMTRTFPATPVRILYTGSISARYQTFTNFEKIETVDDIAYHLSGIDLLIMLDASQYRRFSMQPDVLQQVSRTIAIDHHASEPDSFTLLIKDSTYTSNAELLYHLFYEGVPVPKHAAEVLLLGIVGDTGNFAYVPPTQSQVFLVAKVLLESVGQSIDVFRSRYGGIPKRIIPLLQELVKHTVYGTMPGWPDFQYTYIDRASLTDAYTDEDMSAASHIYMGQYLPRVEGYPWGFVVTPRVGGGCRISGRSLPGSVNVRVLYESLGIGSGHNRAAGGAWDTPEPSECIKAVFDWMAHHAPVLE